VVYVAYVIVVIVGRKVYQSRKNQGAVDPLQGLWILVSPHPPPHTLPFLFSTNRHTRGPSTHCKCTTNCLLTLCRQNQRSEKGRNDVCTSAYCAQPSRCVPSLVCALRMCVCLACSPPLPHSRAAWNVPVLARSRFRMSWCCCMR